MNLDQYMQNPGPDAPQEYPAIKPRVWFTIIALFALAVWFSFWVGSQNPSQAEMLRLKRAEESVFLKLKQPLQMASAEQINYEIWGKFKTDERVHISTNKGE